MTFNTGYQPRTNTVKDEKGDLGTYSPLVLFRWKNHFSIYSLYRMHQWIRRFCNTGADAAIAILVPTLKSFSCNGAVAWSTTCFCYENILQSFEATGSTLKKKGGSVKTVCTPKNIAVVTEAIERSPHSSAYHHSASLRAVWSQRSTDFTQGSSTLPLQNSSYSCTTWTWLCKQSSFL
jgi:hypothetical protein